MKITFLSISVFLTFSFIYRPVKNELVGVDEMEFAFANEKGDQVITITDLLANAQRFTIAFDSTGKPNPIKFLLRRDAAAEDNGRMSWYNFKNRGGYVYEVNGKATNEQSVVLVSNDFFKTKKLLEFSAKETIIDLALKYKIETKKGRSIKKSRVIAQIDPKKSIVLVEFEQKGNSCLGSLVYVNGDQLMYRDYAATYNEISTWRVDDGGEFGIEYCKILAVFEENGNIEWVTDWAGAEGFAIDYMQANTKERKIKSLKTGYRYTAPL